MRRRWPQMLLVALLLFTQQLGIAHLTAHAAERLKDHQGTTQNEDGACAKCAFYASLGSSPPCSATAFVHHVVQVPICAVVGSPAHSRSVTVYRSRAPPISLLS
jgi:hypothetical protein